MSRLKRGGGVNDLPDFWGRRTGGRMIRGSWYPSAGIGKIHPGEGDSKEGALHHDG